jgi:hypothetical protein
LNRSPKVALECPMPSRLEAIDASKGLQQNVLDDVCRVSGVADPLWKPAMRPPHERRQLANEQCLDGRLATLSRPPPQVQRGPGRVRPERLNRSDLS